MRVDIISTWNRYCLFYKHILDFELFYSFYSIILTAADFLFAFGISMLCNPLVSQVSKLSLQKDWMIICDPVILWELISQNNSSVIENRLLFFLLQLCYITIPFTFQLNVIFLGIALYKMFHHTAILKPESGCLDNIK